MKDWQQYTMKHFLSKNPAMPLFQKQRLVPGEFFKSETVT